MGIGGLEPWSAASHWRLAIRRVCSAEISSRRNEAVFVMESAENRYGVDGIALTAADASEQRYYT